MGRTITGKTKGFYLFQFDSNLILELQSCCLLLAAITHFDGDDDREDVGRRGYDPDTFCILYFVIYILYSVFCILYLSVLVWFL